MHLNQPTFLKRVLVVVLLPRDFSLPDFTDWTKVRFSLLISTYPLKLGMAVPVLCPLGREHFVPAGGERADCVRFDLGYRMC